ncbi:hypothetical protein CLI92_09310 [Vandammella animalimorsus]|uniref:Uncharacterized protein n=1 Tax=Vandammella animalimorsus TaxID=2029117 RepID=A0A2A2T4Y8_9BURK|nr:hypothetical protein [Vandammella animalimorsus]PAT30691.1 hypothetical protein CK626_14050 [Vandammella animalimorsus]PAX16517.1 hypothetical protein CLI92_09310 [Vandammella animalimorsus]PAX18932.1 hypothetical protein CLI93_11390 [Vandammella animalimorsus]
MTNRRYTLTITEAQARVIRDACELLARLGLGQWPEFLRHMPGQVPMEYHNAIDRLLPEMAHLLSEHGPQGTAINGWNSHLGIGNRHVPEAANVAFDLHAVIRHRLAWDRAKAEGKDKDRSHTMSVQYDTPMHYGKEPLATMERIAPTPTTQPAQTKAGFFTPEP